MPALAFLAVAGLALFALLFVADATLEPGSPPIVTSQRTGLPAPQYDNAMKTLKSAPAPAPDMTSQAVLAAQPKSPSDIPAKVAPSALETLAEAPPKKFRVEASAKRARAEAPRQSKSFAQSADYQQNQFDRFSIKGY